MNSGALRNRLRDIVYPGLDLHTRNRASLTKFWRTGPREVLDAGSGNGFFSWLAYRSGASVTALNFEKSQVEKARAFLVDYRGGDPSRLRFEHRNLYTLPGETRTFDEIICFEVLEHIRGDKEVAQEFYRVLRPGGVLHLCCPWGPHPRHQAEVLDTAETGGHVRPGYTEQEYRALLEPLGFEIDTVIGIGSRAVYWADEFLRIVRGAVGDIVALPLLWLLLPTVWASKYNPSIPYSLYVRAVKPQNVL